MIISDDQLMNLVVQSGLVHEKNVQELIVFAKAAEMSLFDAIVEKNNIPEENLGHLIANYIQIPFISLSKTSIQEDVFHLLPERISRKYKAIAFYRDNKEIRLALADPSNHNLALHLAKKTNQPVMVYLALERDINNAAQLYRKELQIIIDQLIGQSSLGMDTFTSLDQAPIAKIVDTLIDYAYQNKASDIHIEPQEKYSLIRFRIDGILHDVLNLPKNFHDRIITRIKVASKLRTDEHQSAQDGKMRLRLEEEMLDIRVSIIPIADGEKSVLRLLSSKSRKFTLSDLGMNEKDLKKIQDAFHKSYGMILSTGPTGSGKSTSIYAILKIINTREKNITTIEDPVEYRLKGVNQIQVNTKTNLTFAAGLRSILRQDPNVIFVGEIRDVETAGIAVNAALTGHLVLSTLHTNDAATTLPRLTDMKVEPFLVSSTVNVIVAQRLIRKICDNCRISYLLSEFELNKFFSPEVVKKHFMFTEENHEIRIYKGSGCKLCHNTGYAGRIGIFEVLEVSPNIKKLIVEKANSDVIIKVAIQEGMTTMLDDGIEKIAQGSTTIEEVLRVTKVQL
ncbi:hypothetical protein A3C23_01440 [Candidatus Roizmanbacteria bacterium RIFCSPHIGHO2_02_FULL_37_13b]|uniref:AAA+ ATPase domain-containing protein n=1 Tax=Candidatus Roizmanbacteria bacterium RIFCSPLOWO2_02_FULL_36_11 TaxID=1802071 RepID=A0A1F7JII8_9BACT|nr:MAG: hypothetical protein A3C23_01440 [Candidatus Roizmanbacteria bacterium RIFCSPHIGHO2_02_FULL_37_13b]OGK55401.1 MAG: hypothetical protein A3H78_05910 [Candidatus Roizmanbacteria bacterium RIFCSPLOWO2_02_FULL_36_11]